MYYNTMIDYRTYLETVVLDSLAEQEKLSLTQEELEFHKHTLNEGILRALFKAGKINIPQEELDSIEKSIIPPTINYENPDRMGSLFYS